MGLTKLVRVGVLSTVHPSLNLPPRSLVKKLKRKFSYPFTPPVCLNLELKSEEGLDQHFGCQ